MTAAPTTLATRLLSQARAMFGSVTGRNAMLLLATQGLIAVSGFAFWALSARLFPASQVGLAGPLISSYALVSQISVLGANQSLIRFLPTSPNPTRLLNTAVAVVATTAVIAGLLAVTGLLLSTPGGFGAAAVPIAVLFVVGAIVAAVTAVTDAAMLAHQAAAANMVGYLVSSAIRIGLPFAAAGFGTVGMVGVSVTAQTAIAGYAVWYLRRHGWYRLRGGLDLAAAKRLARFSGTSYLAGIAWVLPMMVLPSMILRFLGAETSAHLYMAITIVGFLAMIPTATTQSLFASASRPGADTGRLARHTLLVSLAAVAAAGGGVVVFGSWVLNLFGAGYAADGYPLLIALIPAQLLATINLTGNVLLKVDNRLGVLLGTNLAGCALIVTAWLVLLPSLGVSGIVAGYAAGQATMAVLHTVLWIADRRRRAGTSGPVTAG